MNEEEFERILEMLSYDALTKKQLARLLQKIAFRLELEDSDK